MTDATHEAAQRLIAEATHEAWDVEVVDLIGTLLAERDMWRKENDKKQTACEQMGARIVALEARVAVARREALEEAAQWHEDRAHNQRKNDRAALGAYHDASAAAIRALLGEDG